MHKKQVLTSLTIWDQLGTSTTGDVRPASPAAAAPGDEAEAERFFEGYIYCVNGLIWSIVARELSENELELEEGLEDALDDGRSRVDHHGEDGQSPLQAFEEGVPLQEEVGLDQPTPQDMKSEDEFST